MYMLLRWDYYRIYAREHQNYMNERQAREEKKKSKAIVKDITGLNKKKSIVVDEPKEPFKIERFDEFHSIEKTENYSDYISSNRFKNIPARVSHRRCVACDYKKSLK